MTVLIAGVMPLRMHERDEGSVRRPARLLGKRAWWMPKRLERIVPDVDIEGESLVKGAPAS
jgi:hypothetical protein